MPSRSLAVQDLAFGPPSPKESTACQPPLSALLRVEAGGADRDRTDDLLNAIQALFRLSYGPMQDKVRKQRDNFPRVNRNLANLLHFERDLEGDSLPAWGWLEDTEPAHGENGIFIEVSETGTGSHPDIGDGAGG